MKWFPLERWDTKVAKSLARAMQILLVDFNDVDVSCTLDFCAFKSNLIFTVFTWYNHSTCIWCEVHIKLRYSGTLR